MTRFLILAALLLTATACTPGQVGSDPGASTATSTAGPVPDHGRVVTVTRVVDGDTIEVTGGERVRLLSVQAPELRAHTRSDDADCGAQAARDALSGAAATGKA